MRVSTRLFSFKHDERYAQPLWEPPFETPEERVLASKDLVKVDSCPDSLRAGWTVKDCRWIGRRRSRHPDLAVDTLGVICVRMDLAATIFEDRRSIELLPIRVEGENWLVVRPLGTTDGIVDTRTSEVSSTTVPGRRVYRWVSLVSSTVDVAGFVRLADSVYGCWAPEWFVDKVNSLGLKGLQFDPVGYVVADPRHAVPRVAQVEAGQRQGPASERITAALPDPGELAAFLADGDATRRALSLSDAASASRALEVLTSALQELGRRRTDRLARAASERLSGIAAAYGDLIRRTHQWTWVEIQHGDGATWIGVKSPEGAHVLALVPYMKKQMKLAAPSLSLLFNMIGAENLPSGAAGQVISIG